MRRVRCASRLWLPAQHSQQADQAVRILKQELAAISQQIDAPLDQVQEPVAAGDVATQGSLLRCAEQRAHWMTGGNAPRCLVIELEIEAIARCRDRSCAARDGRSCAGWQTLKSMSSWRLVSQRFAGMRQALALPSA
jgi:hypothetical protein